MCFVWARKCNNNTIFKVDYLRTSGITKKQLAYIILNGSIKHNKTQREDYNNSIQGRHNTNTLTTVYIVSVSIKPKHNVFRILSTSKVKTYISAQLHYTTPNGILGLWTAKGNTMDYKRA